MFLLPCHLLALLNTAKIFLSFISIIYSGTYAGLCGSCLFNLLTLDLHYTSCITHLNLVCIHFGLCYPCIFLARIPAPSLEEERSGLKINTLNIEHSILNI